MTTAPAAALLLTAFDVDNAHILEAALEQFVLVGIKRSSTDDIARRAGINRVTLYRKLGTKDDIVRAAIAYETSRLLAQIEAEAAPIEDVTERVLHGFVITVTLLRNHPLLQQALAVDREDTLAALTVDAGNVMGLGTAFISAQIDRARTDLGLPDGTDVGMLAAVLVRLVHSLVITPDGPPNLDSPEQLAVFTRTVLLPLITA